MFENQTENIIKQRMLDEINNDIFKGEGSFTHDALAPAALEIAQAYTDMDVILGIVFGKTSYDEYLDMIAESHGIERKEGTNAKGMITFAGAINTPVDVGTILQTNAGLQFVTLSSIIIGATGSATVEFEAVEVGEEYNIPENALYLPIQINGITAITNTAATGGTNRESDNDLKTRMFEKVKNPPSSGNKQDYIRWAKEVSGVLDCKVLPLWNGPGTVKLIVFGQNGAPLDAAVLQNVKNHIDPTNGLGDGTSPIGATVTIVTVTSKSINITITALQININYSLTDIQNNISNAIKSYMDTVLPGEFVVTKKIESLIMNTAGVVDFASLTLNGQSENIATTAEEKAIVGVITFA